MTYHTKERVRVLQPITGDPVLIKKAKKAGLYRNEGWPFKHSGYSSWAGEGIPSMQHDAVEIRVIPELVLIIDVNLVEFM